MFSITIATFAPRQPRIATSDGHIYLLDLHGVSDARIHRLLSFAYLFPTGGAVFNVASERVRVRVSAVVRFTWAAMAGVQVYDDLRDEKRSI